MWAGEEGARGRVVERGKGRRVRGAVVVVERGGGCDGWVVVVDRGGGCEGAGRGQGGGEGRGGRRGRGGSWGWRRQWAKGGRGSWVERRPGRGEAAGRGQGGQGGARQRVVDGEGGKGAARHCPSPPCPSPISQGAHRHAPPPIGELQARNIGRVDGGAVGGPEGGGPAPSQGHHVVRVLDHLYLAPRVRLGKRPQLPGILGEGADEEDSEQDGALDEHCWF